MNQIDDDPDGAKLLTLGVDDRRRAASPEGTMRGAPGSARQKSLYAEETSRLVRYVCQRLIATSGLAVMVFSFVRVGPVVRMRVREFQNDGDSAWLGSNRRRSQPAREQRIRPRRGPIDSSPSEARHPGDSTGLIRNTESTPSAALFRRRVRVQWVPAVIVATGWVLIHGETR